MLQMMPSVQNHVTPSGRRVYFEDEPPSATQHVYAAPTAHNNNNNSSRPVTPASCLREREPAAHPGLPSIRMQHMQHVAFCSKTCETLVYSNRRQLHKFVFLDVLKSLWFALVVNCTSVVQ